MHVCDRVRVCVCVRVRVCEGIKTPALQQRVQEIRITEMAAEEAWSGGGAP